MERIPEKVDSKFRYVLLAATRCEQLMQGASPRGDTHSTKLTRIAMEEIIDDVVTWDYGPPPEPEVVEPEEAEPVAAAPAEAPE